MRLGPSTSTSSTPPTRSALRSAAIRWTTSISRSIRSLFTSSGDLIGHRRRLRALPRAEDEREGAVESDLLDERDASARNRRSVSPGKPTMRSVVSARSGIAARSRSTSAR